MDDFEDGFPNQVLWAGCVVECSSRRVHVDEFAFTCHHDCIRRTLHQLPVSFFTVSQCLRSQLLFRHVSDHSAHSRSFATIAALDRDHSLEVSKLSLSILQTMERTHWRLERKIPYLLGVFRRSLRSDQLA